MSWVPIKRLLKSSVRDRGIGASIDAADAVEAANSILGERFRDHDHRLVRAVSYVPGELTVACRSPVFAEEVRLSQDEIVARIQKKIRSSTTIRLKFAYSADMLSGADCADSH